ncbi:MAG: helix-turn-helix transcriptional regulator [Negativicutes bacterium]
MENKIAAFREIHSLSQVELAEKIGSTQKRISQLENALSEPSISEIKLLTNIFNCKFEDIWQEASFNKEPANSLLIKYVYGENGHVDPNFTKLVYGDSGSRGQRLNKIIKTGSYIFFHTKIGNGDYITGYFNVAKILERGEHDTEIQSIGCDAEIDEIVIIGDRNNSKILNTPLLLDKKLILQLGSLKVPEERFDTERSELSIVSSATREHRELSGSDVQLLLKLCKDRG